jgi:hypothetical protein
MELAGLEPATSWVRCVRELGVSGGNGFRSTVSAVSGVDDSRSSRVLLTTD